MAPSPSFVVACIAVVGAILALRMLPAKEIMNDVLDAIQEQGDMAPVYYSLFLSIWVAALLPCSVLEVVPGFLFGFKSGFFCSVVGKNLGNLWSLLLGRFLFKKWIQSTMIKKYPKLKAIERAIEQGGFKVLMMIRFTYLPMVLKNYGLSVLDIPLIKILGAGVMSGIPFAVVWSFVGSSATNLTDIVEGKFSIKDVLPSGETETIVMVGAASVVAVGFSGVLWSFTKELKVALDEAQAQLDSEAVRKKN